MIAQTKNSTWMRDFLGKLMKSVEQIPVWVDVTVHPESVIFKHLDVHTPMNGAKTLTHTIDFNLSVEENVYLSRELLILNWAPRLEQVEITKRPPTIEEIEDSIKNNQPAPFTGVEEKTRTVWYFSKLVFRTSTAVLTTENLRSGPKEIYALKCPLETLLASYGDMTAQEFYEFFQSKAVLKRTEGGSIG